MAAADPTEIELADLIAESYTLERAGDISAASNSQTRADALRIVGELRA